MGTAFNLCSDPAIRHKEFIIKRHYIKSENNKTVYVDRYPDDNIVKYKLDLRLNQRIKINLKWITIFL
jgi:hypothetical protein